MAKRKLFAPFSPELLLASLGGALAGLWVVRRLLASGSEGPMTSASWTYDEEGRPLPPDPRID